MNQNVFGVILFSVIVGTAIVISEFFVTLPTPLPVYERPVYESRTTCHRKVVVAQNATNNITSIRVTQAVLDQTTNNLDTGFLIKREIPRTKDVLPTIPQTETVKISLHFFVEKGSKMQYLATETKTISPYFGYNDQTNFAVDSSFKWLNGWQKQDNLYVIAEPTVDFDNDRSSEPKFDSSKAVSVLLDRGKK